MQGLKIVDLTKIKKKEKIKAICSEVMTAISKILLVHVDPNTIASRKVKKEKNLPIVYDSDSLWSDEARIRDDWSTKRWESGEIKGFVIYDTDDSVMSTIYTDARGQTQVYMKKEIAENPVGAEYLIKRMKKEVKQVTESAGKMAIENQDE